MIMAMLVSTFEEADAARRRKKRKYAPKKTKTEAIQMIRANSPSVCQLAGLDPISDQEKQAIQIDLNESEDLSNVIPSADEITEAGDYGENIEELEAEDDVQVDLETFNTLWLSYVSDNEQDEFTMAGIKKTAIMESIMQWLGTPYRFGGMTKNNIDCSAFVQQIYLSSGKILLPRTARTQNNFGEKIKKIENLEFGDLVFFHTYSRRFASHVGIYLGDNLFAHASSRYGVTVSSLESKYYKRTFIGGKRLGFQEATLLAVKQDAIEMQAH